jgi:hypothetical protein
MRGPILGSVALSDVGRALGGIAVVGAVGVALTAVALRARVRRG